MDNPLCIYIVCVSMPHYYSFYKVITLINQLLMEIQKAASTSHSINMYRALYMCQVFCQGYILWTSHQNPGRCSISLSQEHNVTVGHRLRVRSSDFAVHGQRSLSIQPIPGAELHGGHISTVSAFRLLINQQVDRCHSHAHSGRCRVQFSVCHHLDWCMVYMQMAPTYKPPVLISSQGFWKGDWSRWRHS